MGKADRVSGDTKAGTFIAQDRYGNKYYENLEDELPREQPAARSREQHFRADSCFPVRTRWVDYKDKEFSPDQIEPGW